MQLVIAGSRQFSDYELLVKHANEFIDHFRFPNEPVEIISGTANGADKLGERYAKEFGYSVCYFEPDWELYGPSEAPKIRNTEMARYASHALIFWDGKSPGTRHMIQQCQKYKLFFLVVNYEKIMESVI